VDADGIGGKETAENGQNRSTVQVCLLLDEGRRGRDGRRGRKDRGAAECSACSVEDRFLRKSGPGEAENRFSIRRLTVLATEEVFLRRLVLREGASASNLERRKGKSRTDNVRPFQRSDHDRHFVLQARKPDRSVLHSSSEDESCTGERVCKLLFLETRKEKNERRRTIGTERKTSNRRPPFHKQRLLRIVSSTRRSGRHNKFPVSLHLTTRDVPESNAALVGNEEEIDVERMRFDVGTDGTEERERLVKVKVGRRKGKNEGRNAHMPPRMGSRHSTPPQDLLLLQPQVSDPRTVRQRPPLNIVSVDSAILAADEEEGVIGACFETGHCRCEKSQSVGFGGKGRERAGKREKGWEKRKSEQYAPFARNESDESRCGLPFGSSRCRSKT
jgi:hypothetical protein